MEQPEVHALTAAYALDALDEVEEREYEAHLRGCESCREELTAFTDVASSLAYAVDAPPPPPALRERVLESVRAERAVVVPLRPRRALSYGLAAAAAAAAAVAIGLGAWGTSLSDRLDRLEETNAVLADPNARTIPLSGADGRLVVSDSGEAALVVSGLEQAPAGKEYEIWVIDSEQPHRAGLFDAKDGRDAVRLERPVRSGETVAVTLEPEGGVDAPTGMVELQAKA